MDDRSELILAATLKRFTDVGTLTPEQADAIRADFSRDLQTKQPPTDRSWTPVVAEVGGYVGAAFVTAAAVALIGPGWANFSQAGRVAVLAGPAVLLLIAAVSVAVAIPGGWAGRLFVRNRDGGEPRPGSPGDQEASASIHRLVGALVLAGGGLLGATAGVLTQDSGSDRWVPVVPLVIWGVGYLLGRGVPLHLGTAVALTWTVLTAINSDLDTHFPVSGLLLVLAGVGWAVLARRQLIVEQALAIAVAGVMAFIGGEYVVASDYSGIGYLILGLLAVVGLAGYVRTRELSALGVGAAALAVVVPQAVIDYTAGSLGAAGGLLISGLSIVAVSVLAARLRRTDSGPTEIM